MKLRIPIFFFCLVSIISNSQTLEAYYAAAKNAYDKQDYETFYTQINKAFELHPYHQVILYQRGIAAALTNHPDEAIKSLHEAILINVNFDLYIRDLAALEKNEKFIALQELQKKLREPIIRSDTAFTVKQRNVHLESIDAGEKSTIFYGSSIHERKIIRVKKGATSDFTSYTENIGAIMSVKVDKKKKELWACASPLVEMKNYDSTKHSGVYQYELRTGKLLKEYVPHDSIKESVLGNLIISQQGAVYVSDSKNNLIFTVNRETGKLDVFYSNIAFWNLQGITLSNDEQYLFIADYIKGVFRLNLETKELIYLTRKVEASLKGIDGLTFYSGSLIAIQNGVSPIRVTRYFLNDTMDSITAFEIIDRGHPSFNEPTNGCLVKDTIYYVANSQWSGYDDNRNILPDDKLQDIVILRYSPK